MDKYLRNTYAYAGVGVGGRGGVYFVQGIGGDGGGGGGGDGGGDASVKIHSLL